MNLYGQDMDETVSPLNAGLAWTVDLKSGTRFHRQNRFGQGWRNGASRWSDSARQRRFARTSSGSYRTRRRRNHQRHLQPHHAATTIAIARVPVSGVAPGDTVQVAIRDKQLDAKVVKLPFCAQWRCFGNRLNLII